MTEDSTGRNIEENHFWLVFSWRFRLFGRDETRIIRKKLRSHVAPTNLHIIITTCYHMFQIEIMECIPECFEKDLRCLTVHTAMHHNHQLTHTDDVSAPWALMNISGRISLLSSAFPVSSHRLTLFGFVLPGGSTNGKRMSDSKRLTQVLVKVLFLTVQGAFQHVMS